MKSSSQATSLVSNVVNASEPLPLRFETYMADRIEEGFTDSWTADDADEEAYYFQPFEAKCKCGVWGCGSQYQLEQAGWHLSVFKEVCPQCTQRSIDLGGRPEWVL